MQYVDFLITGEKTQIFLFINMKQRIFIQIDELCLCSLNGKFVWGFSISAKINYKVQTKCHLCWEKFHPKSSDHY